MQFVGEGKGIQSKNACVNAKLTIMVKCLSFQNGQHGPNGVSDWRKTWWESFEETPLYAAIWTYLGYGLLVLVGHIRDFLRNVGIEKQKSCTEPKLPVSSKSLHF